MGAGNGNQKDTIMSKEAYKDHRAGSSKGEVHRVFDTKGVDAAIKKGEALGLQSSTVRTWCSFWKNGSKKPDGAAKSAKAPKAVKTAKAAKTPAKKAAKKAPAKTAAPAKPAKKRVAKAPADKAENAAA
jgi:hypothetical protein